MLWNLLFYYFAPLLPYPVGIRDRPSALAGAKVPVQNGLPDLERRAQGLRDELDRPLVLAILGEFNAGKSTLVNAFVGADVAPTGILPTTATLKVQVGQAVRGGETVIAVLH